MSAEDETLFLYDELDVDCALPDGVASGSLLVALFGDLPEKRTGRETAHRWEDGAAPNPGLSTSEGRLS